MTDFLKILFKEGLCSLNLYDLIVASILITLGANDIIPFGAALCIMLVSIVFSLTIAKKLGVDR